VLTAPLGPGAVSPRLAGDVASGVSACGDDEMGRGPLSRPGEAAAPGETGSATGEAVGTEGTVAGSAGGASPASASLAGEPASTALGGSGCGCDAAGDAGAGGSGAGATVARPGRSETGST
jgi:hypothetical protein